MDKIFGVMLDCSRNAILSVNSVKRYIDALKKMGYNALLLYTEDTYEVDNEPYFGYLRGKYSKDEIKEIDKYAISNGIELIPCIQTLAHLSTIFRWYPYWSINDIDDVLLMDDPRTYELIENMFKTISECFSSRHINIGQDEAYHMGLGKYLKEHGNLNKVEAYLKHLNKVLEIAKKYNFEVSIWSDMFYKLATKSNDYYETNMIDFEKVKTLAPKDVTLVYWDYYHKDKKIYDLMLKNHLKFDNKIAFAGGIWTWNGFVPQSKEAMIITKEALTSAKENDINEIYLTAWKDNGGECSLFAGLATLFYAKQIYDGKTNLKEIKDEFKKLFNVSFDDFLKLDSLNEIEGASKEFMANPSKYMLYSDPFLGIFDDKVIGNEDILYAKYEKMYKNLAMKNKEYSYLFKMNEKLAKALKYKYLLGYKTRKYYEAKDIENLKLLLKEYDDCYKAIKDFTKYYKTYWLIDNKANGLEITEIRLGGVIQRLISAKERLNDFILGKISHIEELDEKILPIDGRNIKNIIQYNNYILNSSVNKHIG